MQSEYKWGKLSPQTFTVDLWMKSFFFFPYRRLLECKSELKNTVCSSLCLIFSWFNPLFAFTEHKGFPWESRAQKDVWGFGVWFGFFLWTLRWWKKGKGRKLLQSLACSFIVTCSFSSCLTKAQENYCRSSKLLFSEQHSLRVALGWEDH